MNPPGGTALPAPAPVVTPETAEFWSATADGTLLLKRCAACGVVVWYPRQICPDCHSMNTEWFPSAGSGTVYSHTVVRKGQGAYHQAGPYVLAYVELDEGPRVLTNIVDCAPEDVVVGMPVRVVFHDTGEGTALPRFTPHADQAIG